MSAQETNQTADAAVNDVTAALSNTAITEKPTDASAPSPAEGCRLYIGNLAYATTEEGLKEFFKGYLVYVRRSFLTCHITSAPARHSSHHARHFSLASLPLLHRSSLVVPACLATPHVHQQRVHGSFSCRLVAYVSLT